MRVSPHSWHMDERTLVILGGKEYESEVLNYLGVEYLKLEAIR